MKKIGKQLITLLFCVFVAIHVSAQDVEKPFQYETSVFIIHFTESNQMFSGRSNDEYDPTQGFSLIYDIVIKYVYRMKPLNQGELSFNINDFAIWHEMAFINNVRGQRLLLGDHVLSDGSGWVQMNEEDYEKLRGFLVKIKKHAEYPLTDSKEKLIANWVGQLSQDSEVQNYDDHFRAREKYPGDYSAARGVPINTKNNMHEINSSSTSEVNVPVDSQTEDVASSSAKSVDSKVSSKVMNDDGTLVVIAPSEPVKIEPTQAAIRAKITPRENDSLRLNRTNHSFMGWLLLTCLGLVFIWYYRRGK